MGDQSEGNQRKIIGSIRSIFMHTDSVDVLLMFFGFMGCIGDGCSMPVSFFVTSKLMNKIGSSTYGDTGGGLFQAINKMVVVLCYVAASQWLACFLEGYCWTRTSERQASRMRARYLKAVLRQDVGYFDLHVTSTTDAIATVSNDSLLIQDVISEKVPFFLSCVTNFLGCFIVAFLLLWRLTVVVFPFAIFLIIPGLMYAKATTGIARKMREEYNEAEVVVEKAISSIRTVYSFVGESKTIADYSAALEGTVRLGLKQGLAKGLTTGSNSIIYMIWSFIVYIGSKLVMNHGAQGGTVFIVGCSIVVGGLHMGSGISNLKYFSEASTAGQRIMEMIRRVPKIDSDNLDGQILQNIVGEIEFNHVEFAYPSRPETLVFKDLCFKIPAGNIVALVGRSGSGKSTVVALLQRFYDPMGGEILLDGVAINKIQIKWLRSQIGLVNQEPPLFATSIKENILFGKEDADMEDVIAAAKAANAHNFISQLPHGYDTQVGEGGIQLSGGQKQRVAIARAIIKAPRILLLDEATSALDSESEQLVQQALDNVALGCTTIVIAHRLSTIRNVDLIVVVQNGQIVETGSHNYLIQSDNGVYASLVRIQQTEKDIYQTSSTSASTSTIAKLDINNTSSQRFSAVNRSNSTNSTAPSQKVENPTILKEQAFPVPSFWRLLTLNRPEQKQAIVACINAVLSGAVQPMQSFVLGSTISTYFSTDHRDIKSKTRIYALSFVGISIFNFIISTSQHYNFGYMGEQLTKRIRERMLSKILTFELGWFDQDENTSGAICSRLAKDANMVRSLVGDRMSLLIQTFSAVTIACTLGLALAWKFAVVMIAVQPLVILSFYCQQVLLKGMSKKAIKAQDESSKIAAEAVSNLRTITAFCSQARILKMLDEAQEGPRRETIRQSWFAGIGFATSHSLYTFISALNLWYGGKLIAQGFLEPKTFFQTIMILMNTGKVIADAGSMTKDLAKGSNMVKSVFAVLDRCTKIQPDDQQGYKPNKIAGDVELHDVQFVYPSRLDVIIFNDLSLKIEGGKSTALVGHSGSGKSTIIGLIERFYDPIKGIVRIDGRDIRTYHLRSLRNYIALVSQEPTLFARTIRENITYGAPGAVDESEIINAAQAANAHDFIAGLQDGYDTWCGDRGLQLSGGQKQRVAIARAILKNPVILLLDEATSALDSQSEKVVQRALERVMVGRTSVVVAHRLSTIQNCDMIAVLDKGKVVEKGTHSSLLAKGPIGVYHSLVNLQSTPGVVN
ncbi:Xenobiotic-transporting ATPase [Bertholletia excelsa]